MRSIVSRPAQRRPRKAAVAEALEARRLLTAIVVNTPQDAIYAGTNTKLVSLRDAIIAANKSTTPTMITFNTSGWTTTTILLTMGGLELSNTKEAVTIAGPSAGVIVSGSGQFFGVVFLIDSKVNATVSGVTISGASGGTAGGIANHGTLTLTNATVSGNQAAAGGGIYNDGTMTLSNVTVSGNEADLVGGGIENDDDGTMTLTNVTLSGNASDFGGAIANYGTMTLTNVTVSGNQGGIGEVMGKLTLSNSIVAGNNADDFTDDGQASPISLGYNVIGDIGNTTTNWGSTDQIGVDPKLGPLAKNGGPTETMQPQAGSPAINRGSNALALDAMGDKLTTDQRGLPRIYNTTVDVGAVEVQPIPTVTETAPPPYDVVHHHADVYNAFAGLSSPEPLGSFTSTNATGPYTVDVNWGDGSADGIFTQPAVGAIANQSHNFANIGNDTVTITVRDSSGVGVGSGTFLVDVLAAVNNISGEVYFDAKNSGTFVTGDTGIPGAVVYDDLNGNGKWDSTGTNPEPSTTTDSAGLYVLTVIGTGSAVIRQVVPATFAQKTPAGGKGLTVSLTGSSTIANQFFGDVSTKQSEFVTLYSISGTVFNDANKNGKQESGEAGLGGWEVYDDINNNGKLDPGEPGVFTDSTGAFTFKTTGGTLNLREVVPANWSQTVPASNAAYHITVSSTSAALKYNFGDYTTVDYLKTVATTSGLAAWWTFDSGSQANSIVNGYTGTLAGGATITAAAGGAPIDGEPNNTGLALNGSNAFIYTNLTTQDQFTTAATYNVWINLGATPASGALYTIAAKSQFGNDLDLFVGPGGVISFYTDNGTSTSFTPKTIAGWHMVTAEFDTAAKIRKIYWDGQLAASTSPYNGVHAPSTMAFSIGESDVFTGRFFNGKVDEVSLWDRALAASEISTLYSSASSYVFTGTVFDDANKNAKQDTGEAGLAGWEVYDDANNNGKLDAGEPFTFTDSTGAYSLALKSGVATLRQIVPANWSQTTPASNAGYHFTISSTTAAAKYNFGDYTAVKYLSTVATTSGLAAWWTFDAASAANSIINGYTGTLKGGATINSTGGAPIAGESSSSGLSLNGSGAYVDTNLTTQQEFTTAATYNVWIDLGAIPAAGKLVTIAAKSQFGNDLDLFIGGGVISFYTDNGTSTSFTPKSLTGWHMVTAEFDTAAKIRKIYFDGQLVAGASPYTGNHAPSTMPFSIGESDVFTGRYFDGKIDEVSLWNRALSMAEILAIYNASK